MRYANMTLMENPHLPSQHHRRVQEESMIREGMNMWNQRKQNERMNKLKEQREVRNMLENYWPWSVQNERPRGFKNMYDDGIYPIEDFERSKRSYSPIGRGGGGAPIISHTGKKIVRTREDPMLRFQWSNDMRRTVDNTLRYKATKKEQDEYRRQLDQLVHEKNMRKMNEERKSREIDQHLMSLPTPWGRPGPGGSPWRQPKDIGYEFLKNMGWTDEHMLSKLKKERENYRMRNKNIKLKPLEYSESTQKSISYKQDEEKSIKPLEYSESAQKSSSYKQSAEKPIKQIDLIPTLSSSPVSGKDARDGSATDLVPVIASKRVNQKIPLGTTDVTRGIPDYTFEKYKKHNSAYLRELAKQMDYQNQKKKEQKAQDNEQFQKHFSTWENFWGRPGNGAPRSVTKKARLDHLLYPRMVPISVH